MVEHATHPTVLDSGQRHIGTVYAKALLGAAAKAGLTEQVLAELDSFVVDVLERMPKLEATLASPNVPPEAKVRLLDRAFADSMSPVLLKFLKVASKHRRLDSLHAIHRAVHDLYNEATGRVDVFVRTAEPLTDEMRGDLAARLEAQLGRRVNLRATLDEGLIGGIVIRVGDTVYDGSVAQQLRRLRDETLDRTAQSLSQSLERFEANP
jgi:F-type H+-transporting ATPase subunit delta